MTSKFATPEECMTTTGKTQLSVPMQLMRDLQDNGLCEDQIITACSNAQRLLFETRPRDKSKNYKSDQRCERLLAQRRKLIYQRRDLAKQINGIENEIKEHMQNIRVGKA